MRSAWQSVQVRGLSAGVREQVRALFAVVRPDKPTIKQLYIMADEDERIEMILLAVKRIKEREHVRAVIVLDDL